MLFNYDSVPLLVTGLIIGGCFSYSIYSIFTINSTLPTYNEVGVQTESLVNTQPSIDTISELPETVYPVLQPNVLPDNLHVNVGVQTQSLFSMFKEWLKEKFSINSSDIGVTPTEVRVNNWIGNLDNTQVVSTNSMASVVSNNQLPDLVNLGDNILLEYAQSQTKFDIGSRVEYFNTISPQVEVELESIVVNGTQYLFAITQDVILTLNPNIFNLFI